MIGAHLIILQVLVPLVFAPICIIIRHVTLTWLLTAAVAWASFIISCLLLQQVIDTGMMSYAIGDWLAPWGIEYRLDKINAFVSVFITGLAAIILSGSHGLVRSEVASDRIYLFYAAFLLNLAGLLGVIVTGDAFNLFVFIEIASLSSYALISVGKDKRALFSAYEYLIYGTIGATFILLSVGLLYVMTGTLNMADIYQRLPEVIHTSTVKTALAFFTIGIFIKCAVFPLHTWLPNAYTHAPSSVATFLAGTTTKVFIYVFIRFLYSVFPPEYVFDTMQIGHILMLLSVITIFYGSIMAIRQDNLPMLLAYSSIAQIGYMVLAISFNSIAGITAALVHMFNHAIIKTTLFMCVGSIGYKFNTLSIDRLNGTGKLMPWTMAIFMIAGLSLIGVPLTAGFISKWYLIQASLEQGLWIIALVILVASLLAVIYVWRVAESIYFKPLTAATGLSGNGRLSGIMAALSVLAALNLFFGLNTALTAGIAEQAAAFLLGPNNG